MNVPRFQRRPIDTSVYNAAINRKKIIYFGTGIVSDIRRAVKEVTGTDPCLEPKSRKREFITARQFYFYFIKKKTRMTQAKLGFLLGKDHATVCCSMKEVDKFIDIEPEYRRMWEQIDDKLNRIIK